MPLQTSIERTITLDENGGLIQSPKINAEGQPTQRAIGSVGQAMNVISTVVSANRNRQIVASRIMAKYNAERPYDQAKLTEEGLGWRSNFTTKPLPQMIEKVAPRFEEAVDGVKYLTSASLSSKWTNATEKTEKFRAAVTKLVRSHKGWKELVSDVALDNALFGHTVCAWLDEFSWMPQHFAYDEAFLPDGCKSQVPKAQVAVLKEVYLPHELFDYIRDSEMAKDVGWYVENTISTINSASPSQLRTQLTGAGTQEQWYQNATRELTVGSSYMAGASVINVYSLLVREVTGKVSHYRFAGDPLQDNFKDNAQLLYEKEDRFDSTADCLAFYTFQKGNKRLHGSKGVGREIYEMAGMQDRMRNEVVDRGILAGKTFVQGDFKMLHKFKMSVVGATVIVPTGWTFLEQKIDGNIEGFLKLDAYFSMLVDQLVGSVSPRTFQGDRVTKAEVDLFAQREEEGKDSRITRFLLQFVDMFSTIQKRLSDPHTTDDAAKQFQKEMLDLMSREELDELAGQPVAATVRDLTPNQRQMVSAFAAEKRGNPIYNQRALEIEDVTARLGSEYIEKLVLPDEDPTESAEQQRTQLLELGLLTTGQPIPVSPRDNHLIHLQVLQPTLEQLAQHVIDGQATTESFKATVQHLTDHVTNAQQAGAPKEALKPFEDLMKKAGPVLAQLEQLDAQAQQLSAEQDSQNEPLA